MVNDYNTGMPKIHDRIQIAMEELGTRAGIDLPRTFELVWPFLLGWFSDNTVAPPMSRQLPDTQAQVSGPVHPAHSGLIGAPNHSHIDPQEAWEIDSLIDPQEAWDVACLLAESGLPPGLPMLVCFFETAQAAGCGLSWKQ